MLYVYSFAKQIFFYKLYENVLQIFVKPEDWGNCETSIFKLCTDVINILWFMQSNGLSLCIKIKDHRRIF